MGVKTQVVSLGDYRRKTIGGAQQLPPDYFTLGAVVFPPISLLFLLLKYGLYLFLVPAISGEKSPETMALRKKTSDGCEKLIWDFFEHGGQVVIYDANNGTKAARQTLADKFDAGGIHVVLLGIFFLLLNCVTHTHDCF
jgi:6-phosphofructo-2-kinase/fructose-2,6-biphosphatase 4